MQSDGGGEGFDASERLRRHHRRGGGRPRRGVGWRRCCGDTLKGTDLGDK